MNLKFWKKKEKTKEEIFRDMQADEKIALMKLINENRAAGKPESENLIPLREMSYHANIEAEEEKAKTEKANRRSKLEKFASIGSSFGVVGLAFWNAKHDIKGDNVGRTDGGKRIQTFLNSIAARFNDFKGNFFKK